MFFAPRALKGGVCAAPRSSALVLFRSVFRFPWFYYLLNSLLIRHTLRNVNLYFNVILDISIRQSTGLKGYMLADTHRIIIVHLRKKNVHFMYFSWSFTPSVWALRSGRDCLSLLASPPPHPNEKHPSFTDEGHSRHLPLGQKPVHLLCGALCGSFRSVPQRGDIWPCSGCRRWWTSRS